MKTANGYTTEQEARDAGGKYVVYYRPNSCHDGWYVPFTNRKAAQNFAVGVGLNDPDNSPRYATIM